MGMKGLWERIAWTSVIIATSAIVAALIIGSLPSLHDWITSIPGFPAAAAAWLGEPVSITRWHFWLLVCMATFSLSTIACVMAAAFWGTGDDTFSYYRADQFFGIRGTWGYSDSRRIIGLRPHCPDCNDELRAQHKDPSPTCELECTCGYHRDFLCTPDELLDRVLKEIDLSINNGTWRRTEADSEATEGN